MSSTRTDLRSTVAWSLAILIATFVAYLPIREAGFIWDDEDYVTNNDTLRDWQGLNRIWLDPSATPQYYPLVHSTFWIEHQIWGLNATGFHLVNVFIHAINAILLWILLERLAIPGAWWAALIFAVHPVHVESVAWITERKNVLSGMFYLLSMLSYLRYWNFADVQASESTSSKSWFALANVFFVAALLSKTVTATLPAVLVVLIWWKRGNVPLSRALSLTPMFVIGIAFGLLTVWLEKFQVGASGIDWELTITERFLIAGRALWFYAWKLVWPTNLIFTYPRWTIDSSQLWQFIFPIGVIAVLITLWMMRGRIGRGPLAATLVFAGTLFPALGFLDVYPMRFSFVADHFQYLASISLIVLATAVAARFAQQHLEESPQLRRFVAVAFALTLMGLTWQQTKIYEGLEVLWRDTIARNPTSFMAHNNLGALLNRRGDYKEAEKHIREALKLKPGFIDSVVNLGKAREGQGDLEGAAKHYRDAIALDESYAPALNGLGAMLGAKGEMKEAEQLFEQAVQSNPEYVSAKLNLATVYLNSDRSQEAIALLEDALKRQPESIAARDGLIRAYMQSERFEEAKELLTSALEASPNDVNLLGALGVIAANEQSFREAIKYFEEILRLVPGEPNAIYNLSLMHRNLGETAKADEYMKSLELLNPEPINPAPSP